MPFGVGIGWVAYTDAIKAANEFGRMFTSVALEQWNFGTFQQRISSQLFDTVRWRVTPDILGALYPVAFVVLGANLTSTKTLVIAAAALLGFVVPFLVFTNLHIVHNYYQAANALFLVVAVGLGIGRIFDCSQRAVALLLLAGIAAGQLFFFYAHFAPYITHDYNNDRTLRISLIAKAITQPSQSLIVIGEEWGSTVPFYSERKALAVPARTPVALLQKVTTNPQAFLGDRPLGAIVVCPDNLANYGDKATLLQTFVAKRKVLGEFGGCEVLEPSQGPR